MFRLLVIEDNEDDVFLIKEYLEYDSPSCAYELTVADQASDGLKYLSENKFDVVLLDLFLKDTRGLETFYQFQPFIPKVPIVVMTSLDDEGIAYDAVRRGAQDYLVKGQINAGLLNRVIRYAIERQKIRRELADTNARLEQLALVDPLTGLLNRRGLQQVLSLHIPRTRAEDPDSLAILIDMDNFKQINDTLGHAVGDVVLQEVTRKLKSSLRSNDHAARIGGDEFMIVLPKTRVAEGLQVAEKVRMAISTSPIYLSSGETVSTTASIGLVSISPQTSSIDQLLRETHHVLYKSKKQGKNKVSYEANPPSAAESYLNNEELISGADTKDVVRKLTDQSVFRVVRQDIFNLADMSVIGSEFCTRSTVDSYEMPDDFFRLSFENKILTTVDYQCFLICLAAALNTENKLHHHINLFPSTMLSVPTQQLLRDLSAIQSPDKFCIEISEQQLIGEPSYLLDVVKALRKAGFQVAIDDVGFGRSCLESLILLEPEIIKIDKRCVNGIATNQALERSMSRLLNVTRSLKTEVVAEGIESKEDLDALISLGVPYGQGFYLSQPTGKMTMECEHIQHR